MSNTCRQMIRNIMLVSFNIHMIMLSTHVSLVHVLHDIKLLSEGVNHCEVGHAHAQLLQRAWSRMLCKIHRARKARPAMPQRPPAVHMLRDCGRKEVSFSQGRLQLIAFLAFRSLICIRQQTAIIEESSSVPGNGSLWSISATSISSVCISSSRYDVLQSYI